MKNSAAARGMIEIRDEQEQLLDNIMLAMKEADASRRAEQDERTDLGCKLQQAS